MAPRFLTGDEVVAIHKDQIERYGGSHGVRDQGLLESALAQPRQGFGGVLFHQGLQSQAAAYLFHIVKNHPFIDGNKRTGAVAALYFLGLNGESNVFDDGKLEALVLRVAQGQAGKEEVARFFAADSLTE